MPSTETTVILHTDADIPKTTPPAPDSGVADPRLNDLLIAHDDLDAAVAALLASGVCDDLLISRLKKRKLQLKDEITGAAGRFGQEPVARAS